MPLREYIYYVFVLKFERLYATGNCSASVMGRVYPGPGSTLGPTTVFGYISANHIHQHVARPTNPELHVV
ncbi:hypothetical protein ABC255_16555 [Neobacillus sp. 3P2-tot-E-2]|uniref:hypothetical protein n=1 Tax=Neobacillus sp. 3P2-tot-E-2 TaxID=3132212 RepID=UPI0039A333F9